MRLMINLLLLITVLCSFQQHASADLQTTATDDDSYLKTNYSFPYENPYLSTLMIKLLKPAHTEPKTMTLFGRWPRTDVPYHKEPISISISAFIQPKKAPLVYVIPGLGSSALDGGGTYLAEQLYQRGFSALVMPSPFFWRFVVSHSTSGVVGYPQADAEDLRFLMADARASAEKNLGLKVTRTAVVGYSLGAINAGFVMAAERKNPKLGLERAVMINPPMDLAKATTELDKLALVGLNWKTESKQWIWSYAYDFGSEILKRDINDPSYFEGLDKSLKLSTKQIQFLIGASFHLSLSDVIMIGQHVTDTGLINLKASLEEQKNASDIIGFSEYMSKSVYPYWTKKLNVQWTLTEFIQHGDLMSLKDNFATDSAYRLLHNQDDFLSNPEDIATVGKLMKTRAIVYPRGGHVGNIWKKQNIEDIFTMIKDLK